MEAKTKKPKIKNIRGGKLLLKHFESLDWFEKYNIGGLCSFASYLLGKSKINVKQYYEIMNFLYYNKPKESCSGAYWFKPNDKQARIDYLKQLLYDNARTT